MRYDLCPLSNPEDVCPEAEGEYGIEHKDGTLGCMRGAARQLLERMEGRL